MIYKARGRRFIELCWPALPQSALLLSAAPCIYIAIESPPLLFLLLPCSRRAAYESSDAPPACYIALRNNIRIKSSSSSDCQHSIHSISRRFRPAPTAGRLRHRLARLSLRLEPAVPLGRPKVSQPHTLEAPNHRRRRRRHARPFLVAPSSCSVASGLRRPHALGSHSPAPRPLPCSALTVQHSTFVRLTPVDQAPSRRYVIDYPRSTESARPTDTSL